ncbi:MAG: hypothetical protein QS748_07210 [Candidatus Endonucleobacter bathymodioli]|uniref:Uncharacterized protein n=1 Tax=Candidatus Endonucleibacter bathymodioli TaxID=539814 RepID=A0AA90NLX1_9GAMM|nr:hypothetical protein [Candidatus Endonucleobacter bathymodioli]
MKNILRGILLFALNTYVFADTVSFELNISGEGIAISKSLQLSDVGEGKTEINFSFEASTGQEYTFVLRYGLTSPNPSLRTILYVTLSNRYNKRLGGLFFTNNGVQHLKRIGVLGFVVDDLGEPVDIKLSFQKNNKGNLDISSLGYERFLQDVKVSKWNLRMRHPLILPVIEDGVRSQTNLLVGHPYSINYALTNIGEGLVQFQHNLYKLTDGNEHLLDRIYFQADSLETLRGIMYGTKSIHENDVEFEVTFHTTEPIHI